MNQTIYDLVGIGIGPFNLSLAALSDQTMLKTLFIEQKQKFDWHPGLLIESTTLQVPFMADLVTMAQPCNEFSYLNYLHEQDRLYRFYYRENFLIPRREYNHYCQWAAEKLSQCIFGYKVLDIRHEESSGESHYVVHYENTLTNEEHFVASKHIVLGVGSVPFLPQALKNVDDEHIFHSSNYMSKKQSLISGPSDHKPTVTVLGSGQSAGEIYLDLLQQQRPSPDVADEMVLQWFTRGDGFFPMEYSKLGLEHFTPDYQAYFYGLEQSKKDQILPKQDLLYKGMSAVVIAEIYDLLYERSACDAQPQTSLMAMSELVAVKKNTKGKRYTLQFKHTQQEKTFEVETDSLVCATGYSHKLPNVLAGINQLVDWDETTHKPRFKIDEQYRVKTTAKAGNIYVQNAELHTHGVGAPDLGLGAHRSAVIINDILNDTLFKVRKKNAFMSFGVEQIKVTEPEVADVN
mgnify:CR=1 FL=1